MPVIAKRTCAVFVSHEVAPTLEKDAWVVQRSLGWQCISIVEEALGSFRDVRLAAGSV